MSKAEHLTKEVLQAGTGANNLVVYESVEFSVIFPLVGMTEGMHGNLENYVWCEQHLIEVKNYEPFVLGLKSFGRGVAIYLWGGHVINNSTSLML